MYKRTSAKFVTAFIELEERYRKQTKECHLQNSFSEINHTMCWWRCRTQLSTGAKLPQQRSEFFSLRFKNIGCRITSPELGPRWYDQAHWSVFPSEVCISVQISGKPRNPQHIQCTTSRPVGKTWCFSGMLLSKLGELFSSTVLPYTNIQQTPGY